MAFLSWFELLVLEQKLKLGPFGKYNKYRRLCLERGARSSTSKVLLAREVLAGPGVGLAESHANELYLRRSKEPQPVTVEAPKAVVEGAKR